MTTQQQPCQSRQHMENGLALRSRGGLFLVFALVAVYGAVLVRTAWLCDDAYISFRVIDNFVHGFGLRWNVAERVQVYTHPLWLLLLSGLYSVTREIYFTSLVFSMCVSVAAVLVMAFGIARTALGAALALSILTLSQAFVDYSTSGLENPLTHLLLGAFIAMFLCGELSARRLFGLSALAGLAVFNRMDTLLFFAPALVFAIARLRSRRSVWAVAAGFLPFAIWEVFQVFYYGFPFPNTAYAKLDASIPLGQALAAGGYYLFESLRRDPITLACCAASFCLLPAFRRKREAFVAAGALSYVAYLLWIGGDVMSGRFLTGPLYCAVALCSRAQWPKPWFWAPVFGAVVALGLMASPCPTILSNAEYVTEGHKGVWIGGVANNRLLSYKATGLLRAGRCTPMPDHPLAESGRALREQDDPVLICVVAAGIKPFCAGPKHYFLDLWCLGDPLRARMSVKTGTMLYAGHLFRKIPQGYVETLKTGENCLEDSRLARYYDRLTLIVRGPLFSTERIAAIIRMNLGHYDSLLRAQGLGE